MRFAVAFGVAVVGLAFTWSLASAEMSGGKVKIGVLTDLSGPYEQNSGVGSVEAAKMAAEEFGGKVNGVPIEIVSADHQNKPDIGAGIARPDRARRPAEDSQGIRRALRASLRASLS